MRFSTVVSVALMLLSPVAVFAGDKGCHCTKKCMTECKEGHGKKCKCKACECKHDKKSGDDEASCKADAKTDTKAEQDKK